MKYLLLFITFCAIAQDPKVCIRNNGTTRTVWISGGDTNKQYWILTSNDYTVNTTNWYQWNHVYPNVEKLAFDASYSTNMAAGHSMRYFAFGGVYTNQ